MLLVWLTQFHHHENQSRSDREVVVVSFCISHGVHARYTHYWNAIRSRGALNRLANEHALEEHQVFIMHTARLCLVDGKRMYVSGDEVTLLYPTCFWWSLLLMCTLMRSHAFNISNMYNFLWCSQTSNECWCRTNGNALALYTRASHLENTLKKWCHWAPI